jgi:hypothetical protein
MPKRIEITGQKFNMLTAEEYVGRDDEGRALWRFRCDCGNEIVEVGSKVKSGRKKSCGCRQGLFQDHTGEKYNHLTALECVGRAKDGNPLWLCRCDCGNLHTVTARCLVHGQTKSCGCAKRKGSESARARTKHGKVHSRLYGVWSSMKARCYNPNQKSFHNYGGRGIAVCDEWRDDFGAFQEWALANGYDEHAEYGKCTIDRIDVDGDYEPSNCRWVDNVVQGNNTRACRYITIGGVTKTAKQWAVENGINPETAYTRLGNGWDEVDAVTLNDPEALKSLRGRGMAKPVSVSGLGTFRSTTDAAEAIGVSVYRLRGALKRSQPIEGHTVSYAEKVV